MRNANEQHRAGALPVSRRRVFLRAMACLTAAGFPAAARTAASSEPTDVQPVLRALLDRNCGLKPEFGGGFSNHVSMALYSLAALGGTGEALVRLAEGSRQGLEPLSPAAGPEITRQSWRKWLGQPEALNGYRTLFAGEVALLGRADALKTYLPGLMPGVAAAAFHALIRTGYGVRFGDDREVADGLAYWATAYLPLGSLGKAGSEGDVTALLAKLREGSRSGRELSGRLISDKMKAAVQEPRFRSTVDALSPADTTLARVAAAAVRLYTQSGDFTLLHAVTGAHAYRQLAPYVAPREEGIRHFWQAIAAAYVSTGAPLLEEPRPGALPPWAPTLERARGSLDAHDIKLVDIAHEEGAHYRDPIYQLAAARRVRLI
jgi:hypothetical protein